MPVKTEPRKKMREEFGITMTGREDVPVAVFVLCIEAAAFAIAPGVPIPAILLILVMSNPSPALTVLIVVSATTGLILSTLMAQLQSRRTPQEAAPVFVPA
jgi:hypothetical protein